MSKWLEWDPFTGMVETNAADEESGQVIVHKEQDVEGLLDRNAYLRNTQATDIGIKKGLWHYASIPLVVQYEMLTKYGVNIDNRNHWPKVQQLIDQHYPYLKTSDKRHVTKGVGQVFQTAKLSATPTVH